MENIKTKILITGPGFIGSAVIKLLAKNMNYELHVISRKINCNIANIIVHNIDLFDLKTLEALFKKEKFDSLIHFAWYCGKGLHGSEVNLDWTILTLQMIKFLANNNGKIFLGAGSVSEYDFSYGYMKEFKTPLNNNSIYGKAKAACYNMCKEYCKLNNITFKWARIFNLFGKNEKPQRLIPYIIYSILENKDINVSTCEKIQDYSYLEDTAGAIVKFYDSNIEDAVNICSGQSIKLKDIIEKICYKLNFNINKINFGAIPPNFEDNFICGDNSRLINDVQYKYKYSIDNGLDEVIADIKGKINNDK